MKTKSTKPALPETVVYCGPTLRGIAKQYTPYTDGLPDALEQLCARVPLLRELIVPLSKLADERAALNTSGSRESMIFDKAKDLVEGAT